MDDLITFLRARLDEAAEVARAAHGRVDGPLGVKWWTPEEIKTRLWDDQIHMTDAEHIARHDPERVLRGIEAKRALLELHESAEFEYTDGDVCAVCHGKIHEPEVYPCRTVRLLATEYADHPDYQQGWSV